MAKNQCDGCAQDLPVIDGIHRRKSEIWGRCTAHLYDTPAPAAAPSDSISTAPTGARKEQHHDDDSASIDRGQQGVRSVSVERTGQATGVSSDGETGIVHDTDHSRRAVGSREGDERLPVLIDNETLRRKIVSDPDDEPTAGDMPAAPSDDLAAQWEELARTGTWPQCSDALFDAAAALRTLRDERDEAFSRMRNMANMTQREVDTLRADLVAANARADAAEQDAERFVWWFSDTAKSPEFINEFMRGVREHWTLDQWRACIDAERERAK